LQNLAVTTDFACSIIAHAKRANRNSCDNCGVKPLIMIECGNLVALTDEMDDHLATLGHDHPLCLIKKQWMQVPTEGEEVPRVVLGLSFVR